MTRTPPSRQVSPKGRRHKPRVVILLGAGASRPLNIPTSAEFIDEEFYNSLSREARGVLLAIADYHKRDVYGLDVEQVLTVTDAADAIPPELARNAGFAPLRTVGEKVRELIYRRCSAFDLKDSVYHYLPLLHQLTPKTTSRVSVFTTNYDRSFESCFIPAGFAKTLGLADFKPRLVTGFGTGQGGGFVWATEHFEADAAAVHAPEWPVFFHKLHGSVGWIEEDGHVHDVGMELQRESARQPLMILPGVKRLPGNLVSRFSRRRLLEDLEMADQVLVVGFSFRDDYIADIFDHAAHRRASRGPVPGIRIDPSESLPEESRIGWYNDAFARLRHIKRGFGKQAEESTRWVRVEPRTGKLVY